eukprot:GHVP01005176.1.p1 GENE.GHVP01005176.1~~GHVP01005176.1.p1  ORF type:complete len:394 (-),score=52.14 GHVP01005176.1:532-1713(-)
MNDYATLALNVFVYSAKAFIFFLSLHTFVYFVLWAFQDFFAFHPKAAPMGSSSLENQPLDPKISASEIPYITFEDITFWSLDETRLNGWLFLTKENSLKYPTIIYFQSNAGEIRHYLPTFMCLLAFCECNLFAFSYRGYGQSDKKPNEHGIYMDSEAAVEFLLNEMSDKIDPEKIFLYGKGFGAAFALYTAIKYQHQGCIKGVIMENPFTSVQEVMRTAYPNIYGLFGYMLASIQNVYLDSLSRISALYLPLLILCAEKDNLVPPYNSKKLMALCPSERKQLLSVPNANHQDIWKYAGEQYAAYIKHLLYDTSPPPKFWKRARTDNLSEESNFHHLRTLTTKKVPKVVQWDPKSSSPQECQFSLFWIAYWKQIFQNAKIKVKRFLQLRFCHKA